MHGRSEEGPQLVSVITHRVLLRHSDLLSLLRETLPQWRLLSQNLPWVPGLPQLTGQRDPHSQTLLNAPAFPSAPMVQAGIFSDVLPDDSSYPFAHFSHSPSHIPVDPRWAAVIDLFQTNYLGPTDTTLQTGPYSGITTFYTFSYISSQIGYTQN